MDSPRGQEYRIAPELRRCCWYAVIGAVLVGGVAYWSALVMQNRGVANASFSCVALALLSGLTAFPLRWRCRLDGEGIWRRRLFWWDLWRWSDLGSGRIRKQHPYTLYDPKRPWWRRKLRFASMSAGDIREVVSAVNRHYRLPPPPDIPEKLVVKYGICRAVTFDGQGVHASGGGMSNSYLWDEVRKIRVTRMDPMRRDFWKLVIVLPDQEIELRLVTHQGGTTTAAFFGATAEEVDEALVRHVSPDRIDTYIVGERLTKREDIERELAAAERAERAFVVSTAIMLILLVSALIYMAIHESVLKAAAMAGMSGLLAGLPTVLVFRRQRKRIDELNQWLSVAVEAEQTAVACGSGLND